MQYQTPVTTFRAKTNAERQRNFRRRNPGYHRRYYKSAAKCRMECAAFLQAFAARSATPDPAAASVVATPGTQLLLFADG